jgi:hypothetical protein
MQQCKNCYGAVANMMKPKLDEIETLRAERDSALRDAAEWKQEHENLLSVRDADLAVLSAQLTTLQAKLEAAEKRAEYSNQEMLRIAGLNAENFGRWKAAEKDAANMLSLIGDIAKVAGEDVPDAIDNDGQPYQSAALHAAILAAIASDKE